METRNPVKSISLLLVAAAWVCSAALAGGPLYVYDPATKTPGAWPAGDTAVYTDLSDLGPLSNDQADAMVASAIAQWNGVPTSSFHAVGSGDFASIGLPEITADNIFDVLGAWNGGGIHIVYDQDGSIHDFLFGPYSGILGFTTVEWVSSDSPAILEVTIVLNGSGIPTWVSPEDAMQMFSGVVTHEFGHAINLAHTQTNGQLYSYYDPYVGPEGCSEPYVSFPTADDVETMYPYINLYGDGPSIATVDRLDDTAVLSDIYPAAGWPDTMGTIRGTVQVASHGPHTEEYTGVNVIARNLADPFGDAISAISGDYTQGAIGPDGSYTFDGLTPGASYAVYLDGILAGAFSTPYETLLPGPEEYYNGAEESADGITDDRCAYTAIEPVAGAPTVADVIFNQVQGAPTMIPIELPYSSVADLSGDGNAAVGTWGGGMFRWTPAGVDLIGGSPYSPSPGISEDGTTIVGEITDSTTFGKDIDVAAIWQGGESWMPLGLIPGNEPCDQYLQSAWDVSDTGKVVGLSWKDCRLVSAYEWTAESGFDEYGNLGDSDLPGSRANSVSADGVTVVGWDQENTGFWRGVRWDDGQESLIELDTPAICDTDPSSPWYTQSYVGTAYGVNRDASAIVGEGYPHEVIYDFGDGQVYRWCDGRAWMWTAADGVRSLGEFQYDGYRTAALDVSDDARVVVGVANPPDPWSSPRTMLWTEVTGAVDFQEFLAVQGLWAPNWILAGISAVSGDGHSFGGGAYSPYSIQGFIVQIDKVVVCHNTPATKKKPGRKDTIAVTFPDSLGDHLAHGDTLGVCGNGM